MQFPPSRRKWILFEDARSSSETVGLRPQNSKTRWIGGHLTGGVGVAMGCPISMSLSGPHPCRLRPCPGTWGHRVWSWATRLLGPGPRWAKMGQNVWRSLEIFGDGSNKHYGTPKCWLFQQFQRLNLNNTQQTQWFRVLTALTVEPVPVFWLMIVHLCSGIQGFQKFLLLCCKYSHGSSHRANHQFMT